MEYYNLEEIDTGQLKFTHCSLLPGFEHKMSDAVEIVSANFYTIAMTESKGFAHVTRNENIEKIKETGLKMSDSTSNHLGKGNYCLSGDSDTFNEDIVNFAKILKRFENPSDFSIVFGYYYGPLLFCYSGDDDHRGYTVLKENVPADQITKVIPLDELIGEDLIPFFKNELRENYEIIEEKLYQEYLKSLAEQEKSFPN